jgi:quercetin dioxygenase-like cupin family protein
MPSADLQRRGTVLVRRVTLAPGEATPWHRDPHHRVTVVLTGGTLEIEFRDGRPAERVVRAAGAVDWDEPFEALHRARNVGPAGYEEVVVFLLDRAGALPQPEES